MTSPPEKQPGQTEPPPAVAGQEIDRLAAELQVPPGKLREAVPRIAQMVLVDEEFSGPLPHPRHLKEYEKILPGAADRILSMAEGSLDHFTNMDESALTAKASASKRGMYCGTGLFALLTLAAFGALYLTGGWRRHTPHSCESRNPDPFPSAGAGKGNRRDASG